MAYIRRQKDPFGKPKRPILENQQACAAIKPVPCGSFLPIVRGVACCFVLYIYALLSLRFCFYCAFAVLPALVSSV